MNGADAGPATMESYIQPAGTANGNSMATGGYYKVGQNTSANFAVNAIYSLNNSASGTYDLRMEGITWSHTGNAGQDVGSYYMANDPLWISQAVYLQGSGITTVCGNKFCEAGENTSNCPQDCLILPVCGNKFCEAGENSANCPQDCGTGKICYAEGEGLTGYSASPILACCPGLVESGNSTCNGNSCVATEGFICKRSSAVCGNGICESGEADVINTGDLPSYKGTCLQDCRPMS